MFSLEAIFIFIALNIFLNVTALSDADKGKKAIAEFGRNAKVDDFPAGIDEEAFFRTVKHALGSCWDPGDDPLFGIPEKRYKFDLNRPLNGRKFPLLKKERPEVIAAVAKLAGLSKVSNTEGKEEYDVASDVVNTMRKLYRILQVHLVQKYDTIHLETNPNDKKNKMKDIEEKFWKIQKEITKL